MNDYNNFTITKKGNCPPKNNESNTIILPKIHNAYVYKKISTSLRKENKTQIKKLQRNWYDNKRLFSKNTKPEDYLKWKLKKKYDVQKENDLEKSVFSSTSNNSKTNNNYSIDLGYKINGTTGKNTIVLKVSEGQQTEQNNNYNHLLTVNNSMNNCIVDNLIIKKSVNDSIKVNSKTIEKHRRPILMNFREYHLFSKKKKKLEDINFDYQKFNEYKISMKKINNNKISLQNTERMKNYKNYDIFDYKEDYKKFIKLIKQQNSERRLNDITNVYNKISLNTIKYKNKVLFSYDIKKKDINHNDINKKNGKISFFNKEQINLKKKNRIELSPLFRKNV